MQPKSKGETAHIGNKYCKTCGWPVIDVCCNEPFTDFKDAANWDWWYYCSNKGCVKHDGEGVFQIEPDWIGTNNAA